MKNVRNILSAAALAAAALAVAAPGFADGGLGMSQATGVRPCTPETAALVSGSWTFSTRTAPFGATLSVDANCNVWGAYARVEGFTYGGNITGKLVGDTVILNLRQFNGQAGAGTLAVTYYPEQKQNGLKGIVAQGGDTRPLDHWAGLKQPSAPSGAKMTALNDVDVYAGPGGKYRISGMMRKGAMATKLDHNADGWCKLQGVANGADGWVADDHLNGC